jgi:hypothetical protein
MTLVVGLRCDAPALQVPGQNRQFVRRSSHGQVEGADEDKFIKQACDQICDTLVTFIEDGTSIPLDAISVHIDPGTTSVLEAVSMLRVIYNAWPLVPLI